MSMEKLWAPWRVKYINQIDKHKGCVFCRILKEGKDDKNFVFARKKHTFAVLNIYPYNNGHSLVLPYRHVGDLEDLTREEREEMMDLVQEVKGACDEVIEPGGYNIGINLGRLAGAGFPGHLHVHIVPRWKGDSNFMPVTADTRIISQSLKELHKRLKHAHKTRN
jgi:ATP adenylyltransferase